MTSNSIKKRELEETIRANQEKERQGREALDIKKKEQVAKKKAMESKSIDDASNTFIKGLSSAGALLTGSNDRSFYDKLDPSLSNELKVAITTYAALPDPINNDDCYDFADGYGGILNDNYARTATVQKAGIFVYDFVPYIGDADGSEQPTRSAIRLFHSIIRAANTGPAMTYDGVDIFMMPLAADSFATIQAWIERGLNLTKFINPRDLSSREYGLLVSHCFENTNLARTFIDMGTLIIAAANKARIAYNALNIPYEFDYVKRHVFLAGNVFKDGENVGANYHIVNPRVYYTYDEENSRLSVHNFKAWATGAGYGQATVNSLASILMNMINPLIDSQSVAIMSGDMLRAFGDLKFTMPLIDISFVKVENTKFEFVTDIKYLQSFKNAVISDVDLTECTIYQAQINGEDTLVQGDMSGSTWLGIETKAKAVQFPASEAVTSDMETVDIQFSTPFSNYIDYYDPKEISEEDQLYNLSFVHTVRNTDHRIRNARSEILTSFSVKLVNISNDKIVGMSNAAVFGSNYLFANYRTDSTDLVEGQTELVDTYTLALTLSQFNFIPKIMIYSVAYDNDASQNYIRGNLVWNRNVNRRWVETNTIDRIQFLSLVSMFYHNKSSVTYQKNGRKGKNSHR